ncbi:MAG: hypothetical protein ACI97B_000418 [Verrucomicrobiales bacterium]|jgi:hypothetical protein
MTLKAIQKFILAALVSAPFSGFAQEKENPFEIFNRVRVEYDDNIRQSNQNEDSSLKIIEEAEFIVNFDNDISLISLRYNPAFVYWTDRDEDDTDLHHQFDLVYDHELSPRAAVSVKDIFRLSELPELIENGNGAPVRESNDYIYNSLSGGLTAQMATDLTGALDLRHSLLSYDDSAVAKANDYDTFTIGADLSHQLRPTTSVEGQARYTSGSYDDNLRDFDSIQLGAKVGHQMSPRLMGSARAGFETRSLDSARDDADSPYVDGQMTYVAARNTRLNLGAGFGLSQTPLSQFASSERTSVFGGITQDLTPRLTVNVNAQVFSSDFSVNESTAAFDPATDKDGTEEVLRLSGRVSYKLNQTNWLEAGWQYVDLSSEIRPGSDYERNRLHLGWKIQL